MIESIIVVKTYELIYTLNYTTCKIAELFFNIIFTKQL